MSRQISSATTPDHLKLEAKRWLKAIRAGDGDARTRFAQAHPKPPADPGLRDVQLALAREYGYDGWVALLAAVAQMRQRTEDVPPTPADYEALARDLVDAFDNDDADALARVNRHYRRTFSFADLGAEIWRRVYAYRQRTSRGEPRRLQPDEARTLIAQDVGYANWAALVGEPSSRPPRVPAYAIDAARNTIAPRRQLDARDWNEVIAVMRDRRITAIDSGGLMTDAVLGRIAALDHVTSISLEGSRLITDEGLQQLARMPQLERLNLTTGAISDRGLEVFRHLPNLRWIQMTWQQVSDAGASLLRFCDRLEHVDFMGSTTGDGLIEALAGKPRLRFFSTGRLVTDAGLPHLHQLPRFAVLDVEGGGDHDRHPGAHLLIDGPFTDRGLAALHGLDGVSKLDLFWHVKKITSAGFAHLTGLPNLRALGADGELSDNEALAHIARIPGLRDLRIQETVADDEGFVALSKSASIEGIWGRTAAKLHGRGFAALSTMPALRSLGINCANVEDSALALFPSFPSLRELTPVGVTDPGFRHIGGCPRLERLSCMYCRDTTDVATEYIRALPLKYYYAGLTKITDRSLEILGSMPTLEQIEFYECDGITDAGLAFLATLPNLRDVAIDSSPGVTLSGTAVFPPHVRVRYST